MRQASQIVNSALIVGGATELEDILMQWLEHNDKEIDFTWGSYKGMRTFKRSLVGGGLGYVHYCYQIGQKAKLPISSDDYVGGSLKFKANLQPRQDNIFNINHLQRQKS